MPLRLTCINGRHNQCCILVIRDVNPKASDEMLWQEFQNCTKDCFLNLRSSSAVLTPYSFLSVPSSFSICFKFYLGRVEMRSELTQIVFRHKMLLLSSLCKSQTMTRKRHQDQRACNNNLIL